MPRTCGVTSTSDNPYDCRQSKKSAGKQVYVGIGMSKSPGTFLLVHPDGKVGPVASSCFSTEISIPVEESPAAEDSVHTSNEVQPVVVDKTILLLQRGLGLGLRTLQPIHQFIPKVHLFTILIRNGFS